MPISLYIAIALLCLLAGWVFSNFFRRHMQGEDAPEQTVDVTILDKQAIANDEGEASLDDQEYWIYVQKGKIGPKREFQVGIHYFQALNPGDKGTLTYQGDKFLHFAMKR